MQKNYNENLVAGAAIRDDKGRRISKLFESPHPKMTVGYAKNLIMPNDPTEQEFNFRQAGGGVIEDGVAVIDKVKGRSLVWNQQLNNQRVEYARMNVVEDMGTTLKVQVNERYPSMQYYVSLIKGHKYLSIFNHSQVNVYTTEGFYFDVNGVKEYTSDSKSIRVVFQDNQDYGAYPVEQTYEKPFFYDLTQMFGAGNEPSTYEEFLQRKPKVADEYAYNEGTIVNNKVEGVKTTGVNLWDEEWNFNYIDFSTGEPTNRTDLGRICSANFIKVDASKQFYFKCNSLVDSFYIHCYDANKNWLGVNGQYFTNGQISTITIPNTAYVKFAASVKYGNGTTYNHDICINISDPTINGQYFPYEKHELDLSWIKEIKDAEGVKLFEDGMKSAITIFDEAAKGRATKKVGVKVFDGTEDWGSTSMQVEGYFTTASNFDDIGMVGARPSSNNYVSNDDEVFIGGTGGHYLYIRVAKSKATDNASLKHYLAERYAAGTPLVVYYELAEPIDVEYDEKNLTYPVVAGGTEEAIAGEPSTAFRADIGYGIDAVKTILDLKARVEALEGK